MWSSVHLFNCQPICLTQSAWQKFIHNVVTLVCFNATRYLPHSSGVELSCAVLCCAAEIRCQSHRDRPVTQAVKDVTAAAIAAAAAELFALAAGRESDSHHFTCEM